MLSIKLDPRFSDTDALGHINNTAIATWMETARTGIFRIFTPDLDPKKWQLILAHLSIDYHLPAYYGQEVEIQTWVDKLGNSSFHLGHKIFQAGKLIATGKAVLVHYDYEKERSVPIIGDVREQLEKHLPIQEK